ncbi:MAG TPA: BON domain-containing protein [Longimicrobiales bacterium]
MQFDREERYGRQEGWSGPEEPLEGGYGGEGAAAERRAVRHGYAMGYAGGALRSRGSYQAGQVRSGLNPRDEFEFEWGDGYVGGRGYGGTNYDYEHGYRLGTRRVSGGRERGAQAERARGVEGQQRGYGEPYGPARYGYGPYHERLRRRRRSDEEIREDVEETLFYDTWVDADRIEVSVEEGVVTLRGTLPSYDEVRYAVDDAWDVDGVRGVRSELQVGAPPREHQERESGAPAGPAAREASRAARPSAAARVASGGPGTEGAGSEAAGAGGASRSRARAPRAGRTARSGSRAEGA